MQQEINMGKIIFALYFVFLTGISNAATLDEIRKQISQCERNDRIKQSCYEKFESTNIKNSNNLAQRKANALTINAKAKKVVFEHNLVNNDSLVVYTYGGFLKDIGYHLVLTGFWEGSEIALVSAESGEIYKIYEIPYSSPSKTKMVSVSASEAYNPNEIVVLKITPTKLTEEYRLNVKGYRLYEFISWDTEDTIKLKYVTHANKQICPKDAFFMTVFETLKNTNGTWSLQKDNRNIECQE